MIELNQAISDKALPKGTYDYFFSLGEACPTAMLLKKMGLRSFSGPFDWVSGTSFCKRADILMGKIPLISDADEWLYQGERFEPEPRDIYQNKRLEMGFPHDFPLRTPLTVSLPMVRQKYERRLIRLQDVLNHKNRVLAVYMISKETTNFNVNEINQVCIELNQHFTATIDVLCIRHNSKLSPSEFQLSHQSTHLNVIECCFMRNQKEDIMDVELLKRLFIGYHCSNEKSNQRWLARQKLKKKIKSWFINKRIKGDDFYYRILGFKYRPKSPKIK